MKYKINKTESVFPIPSLLSPECIRGLTLKFGIRITKEIKTFTTITKEDKEYGFWDKLIRTNRGARIERENY